MSKEIREPSDGFLKYKIADKMANYELSDGKNLGSYIAVFYLSETGYKGELGNVPEEIENKSIEKAIDTMEDLAEKIIEDIKVMVQEFVPDDKTSQTLRLIDLFIRYGQIDGEHHKAWVIDQALRIVCGDKYDTMVASSCAGEDGPNTYEWDCGIAP